MVDNATTTREQTESKSNPGQRMARKGELGWEGRNGREEMRVVLNHLPPAELRVAFTNLPPAVLEPCVGSS